MRVLLGGQGCILGTPKAGNRRNPPGSPDETPGMTTPSLYLKRDYLPCRLGPWDLGIHVSMNCVLLLSFAAGAGAQGQTEEGRWARVHLGCAGLGFVCCCVTEDTPAPLWSLFPLCTNTRARPVITNILLSLIFQVPL